MIKYREKSHTQIVQSSTCNIDGLEGDWKEKWKREKNMPDLHAIKNGQFCSFFTFQEVHLLGKQCF